MKIVLLALIVIYTLTQTAQAQSNLPLQLEVGYEGEGKVDPSPQACLAHAQGMGFPEKGAAKYVCAARKRHVDAYATLQSNYRAFVEAFSDDRRLNVPGAVSNLKALIKACIDHKYGITTGGHNVMIDIIENDISAGCLTLGSDLIKDETIKYKKALATRGPIIDRVEAIRKTFVP